MKIIISLIATLAIGGFTGWTLNSTQRPNNQASINAESVLDRDDSLPIAEDFVSLRPALNDLPDESLSEAELAGLVFMREEEKLARDVYLTLYTTWGLQIFSNIAQSEQTHTEAIRDLLNKYSVVDPVTDDSIGIFTNPELQTLYNQLTTQGVTALEDALIVGVTIEELDIRDIQVEIDKTDNADITLVYENLMRGSRNHLRSFMSQLESRGGTYQPQYITVTEFNQIQSSEKETGKAGSGGNGGNGQGNRQGRGRGN
jgi:hypothetical protein